MTQSTPERVTDRPFGKPDATARRTRLREFQAQLVERMQAAKSGIHAQQNQLGVMIGQSRWLLNLQEAGEIVSAGTITKVPLTQDWFLGLTSIRGNLISVIDFARFQGMAPTPIEKENRIIAFAPSLSFNSGLLVSRVMGLRNVADMELDSATDAVTTSWSVKRYRDRDAQIWSELNLSLVIQDPHFLHVGL
jgi:twitching motility protein PilI